MLVHMLTISRAYYQFTSFLILILIISDRTESLNSHIWNVLTTQKRPFMLCRGKKGKERVTIKLSESTIIIAELLLIGSSLLFSNY